MKEHKVGPSMILFVSGDHDRRDLLPVFEDLSHFSPGFLSLRTAETNKITLGPTLPRSIRVKSQSTVHGYLKFSRRGLV